MKKVLGALAIASTLLMASCSTITPLTATSNDLGAKVGEASVNYLFGSIPLAMTADLGIQKAAQKGGITKISTVDEKYSNYVLWTTKTTIVTGE